MPSIAIIGTNIGSTLHVRALKAAGFSIAAMVGRDPDRTAQRAAHFAIPRASTSVEEVLDSDIDAVVIATPPLSHHPIAMAAIAAGKHVLCEKPLAGDASLAREMRDAAEEASVAAALQHQFRWLPGHAFLRRLVAERALGELVRVDSVFDVPMTQMPGPLDVPDWWLKPETGGGWLRNWNSHGIDLIRYMIGDFAAVTGTLHADPDRGMSADDGYSIAFVLKNGVQGTMSGSCRSWAIRTETRAMGTNAAAACNLLSGMALSISDADGTREQSPPEDLLREIRMGVSDGAGPDEGLPAFGEGMYRAIHANDQSFAEQTALCTAFARKIADRSFRHPALADFSDGVAALEVIEAVERASRLRQWVELG